MTNTENNIPAVAGYIVHDDTAIHGYGATREAAWDDMLRTMEQAAIAVLGDEEDSTDQLGSWTRASDMVVVAATADLLGMVEEWGGMCGWRNVGGVACTRFEAEG